MKTTVNYTVEVGSRYARWHCVTEWPNGAKVSTVDLVMEKATKNYLRVLNDLGGQFETMVFAPNRDDLDMQRYTSKAEAETGHALMVTKWKRRLAAMKKGTKQKRHDHL